MAAPLERCLVAVAVAVGTLSVFALGSSLAQPRGPFQVLDAWQTMELEHGDRKNRLVRLADLKGVSRPEFHEYMIAPSEHRLAQYPAPMPVLRVVFRDHVFFDLDKDNLKPEAQALLATIAASLRLEPPDVTAFIAGHTDAIGSVNYNLGLGLRRARSVAVALANDGIDRSQLFLVAFGKAVPVADNLTAEGRARNRRVEFLFAARPEPIAAWLAKQSTLTCTADESRKGDNCPQDLRFRAESVTLEPPPRAKEVILAPGTAQVPVATKSTPVIIGSKVIDIDLRQKVFTIAPPR